jgi:ribonuclease HI
MGTEDSNVLGRSRARGTVHRRRRWRRREGAVANVRRTANGREERELGGCSHGREGATHAADGRRTKNSDVGWTVKIEGWQNGRTTGRQTTLTFLLISSIDYVHRSSIQSQALADFIADWTPGAQEKEINKDGEAWTVFCDGSWGTFGAGAAVVLVAPSKVRTCYTAKLDFSCTNNIAEYEALLLGLRKLRAMGIRRAILKTDSQVISGHIDKSSKARDPKLEKYLDTVRRLEASFEGFSLKNIPRGENEHAELLAKSAA